MQIDVDDIAQLYTRIHAHKVKLYRDINDNFYHIGATTACQREFLVQDPDGYLLRFCQYIEP